MNLETRHSPAGLCRPAQDLACCRCCPPVRPAGYDHLDHRQKLTPLWAANRADFLKGVNGGEIQGDFCWGLGFLDEDRRLVGCLLHPARNQGRDRRGPTGFQQKCAREVCPQFRAFAELEPARRARALALARRCGVDADSFVYSSPRTNPLWSLLAWGSDALPWLEPWWDREDSALFAFLRAQPQPRALAWPLVLAARTLGADRLNAPELLSGLEKAVAGLKVRLGPMSASPLANEPFVHRLGLEPLKADFIRLGLGLPRLNENRAFQLAARMEELFGEIVVRELG